MPPITRRRAPEPAIGPEEEQRRSVMDSIPSIVPSVVSEEQRRAIETMSQAITYFEELG